MGMNFNDFTALYRNSQEKQVEINGNTIRAYPSDFGPGANFENGVEFEALIVKSLAPSTSNIIYVSFSPGAYNDVVFSPSNSYIVTKVENPDLTTGLTTSGDGYTISGNTLSVTQEDAKTLTERWNDIYDNFLGFGVPASDNKVILKIEDGVYTTQTFTYYPADTIGQHIIVILGDVVLGVTYNPTAGERP